MMELPMIQELLAGPAKCEMLWPPTKAWKRFLPLNRQALEFPREAVSIRGVGFTGLPLR